MNLSRRQFLRGDFRQHETPIRPPGALDETGFLARCTRCSACIEACPEKIIKKDQAGYPVLDFSMGGCAFCNKCADVCEQDALQVCRTEQPFSTTIATITDECLSLHGVNCRICEDACEPRAIRFKLMEGGLTLPWIETSSCTGCGFCVSICPSRAIRIENKPDKHEEEPCPSSTSAVC